MIESHSYLNWIINIKSAYYIFYPLIKVMKAHPRKNHIVIP